MKTRAWTRRITYAVALTVAASLAGASDALAQYGPGPGSGWGWHPMMGFGGGWIGIIMGFVFWGLIIVGLVFLVKWLVRSGSAKPPARAGRALDILQERYARGEIDKEQYEAMKEDLMD